MTINQFTEKTLRDIEVKATEMFDRNFEQQGFFGKKWDKRKGDSDPGRGILMGRGSGRLRRGIRSTTRSSNSITWTFDVPYAKIHNEGGTIVARQNVRPFTRVVKGKQQNVKGFSRNVNIKIPQRQFIGDHKQIRDAIGVIINRNAQKLIEGLGNNLRNRP